METSNAVDFSAEQVTALRELQSIAPVLVAANAKKAEAQAEAANATDHAILAAIACGDWSSFEPVIVDLENRIRDNIDGEAERWNAKPAKTDGRFVVPSSVSGIKSQIKRAFERGIPLTENGEPRTFNAIKEDNADATEAERESAKAEARAEAVEQFGDLREYAAELVSVVAKAAREASEAELASIVTDLERMAVKYGPEAETVESENDSSAVALAA